MSANKLKKNGRPSDYTPELAKEICEVIASSSKGLKRLCIDNPHWPNKDTIFTWLKKYHEFSDQYAHAKRCQIETFVDEIIEIADDASQDVFVNEQGTMVCNHEFIARSRLRIDTRKWLASKLVPKVYGLQQKDSNATEPTLIEKLLGLTDSPHTPN
jgi:hypothetical protein